MLASGSACALTTPSPASSAQLNCPNQPAQQGFPSRCPAALLPRPLPRTPLLTGVPVAHNAGCAVSRGTPAQRGRWAWGTHALRANTAWNSTPTPSPARPCCLNTNANKLSTKPFTGDAGGAPGGYLTVGEGTCRCTVWHAATTA